MTTNNSLKKDLDVLKDDASKVLTDISKLTKSIPEKGKEKTEKMRDDALEIMEQEMNQLKERLADIQAVLKIKTEKVDKHVHENPYLYIASAVGFGVLLGKVFLPSKKE